MAFEFPPSLIPERKTITGIGIGDQTVKEGLLGEPRCSSMAWTIWCSGSQALAFICHIFPFSSSKSKSHDVSSPRCQQRQPWEPCSACSSPSPHQHLRTCRMCFHNAGSTPGCHLCPWGHGAPLRWSKKVQKGPTR